ncbi:hypothetical protein [Mesonia sp.]|uniref:hypothetical protein n=1 Tax=Mesonia sp. TaxID=1960830 RepID=UPI00174FD383|nr:hypothetical protein [Mesonia sp.]HIB36181.1 hypothetical protein [Mesonia sp.]HIO27990.1 hypothetical protein [Flavobacteriaceae bacterium]
MKRFILFAISALLLASCSVDDSDNLYVNYELVPVDSVVIPDTLDFGQTYDFEVTYERPTDCHFFEGFDYNQGVNERIIGVVNSVVINGDTECLELEDELVTQTLPFEVIREDYYIFKFWQGVDEEGEYIYLTKEVPVRTE